MKKENKVRLYVAIAIAAVIFFWGYASRNDAKKRYVQSVQHQVIEAPKHVLTDGMRDTPGLVFVDTKPFPHHATRNGAICDLPEMHILGTVNNTNCWWQLRLDGDDSRVYTLCPSGWIQDGTTNKELRVDRPAHCDEWRILPMPGFTVTESTVTVEIITEQENAARQLKLASN